MKSERHPDHLYDIAIRRDGSTRVSNIRVPPGAFVEPPPTKFPPRSDLDWVVNETTAFASVAELIDDMRRTNYTPTLCADKDHRLLYVAAELEHRNAPRLALVYFTSLNRDGMKYVASCMGFPGYALERARKAAGVDERGRVAKNAAAVDRIRYRELAAALGVA